MGWGGCGWFCIILGVFRIVVIFEDCNDLKILNIEVLVVFGDGGENGGVIVGFDIFDILLEVMLFLFRVLLGFMVEGDSV